MKNKNINKQIRKISNTNSLLLLIFFAVTLAGGLLISNIRVHSPYFSVWRDPKFLYLIQQCTVYLVLIPLLLLIFGKTAGGSKNLTLRQTFIKPRRPLGWCIKWIVISIGAGQFFGKVCVKFLDLLVGGGSGAKGLQIINSENDILGIFMYFIPCVLFAPFFEELLFRACLFRNTEPMGQWFAAIVTGISFGLWHGNTNQLFMASIIGMFFCLMYIKTGSIIVPMTAHFINNFLIFASDVSRSFISQILSSKDVEFVLHAMFINHTVPSVIYCLTAIFIIGIQIAGVVLFIIQLIKKRKSLSLVRSEFGCGTLKKTAVYFSAPITLIAFVCMTADIVLKCINT